MKKFNFENNKLNVSNNYIHLYLKKPKDYFVAYKYITIYVIIINFVINIFFYSIF